MDIPAGRVLEGAVLQEYILAGAELDHIGPEEALDFVPLLVAGDVLGDVHIASCGRFHKAFIGIPYPPVLAYDSARGYELGPFTGGELVLLDHSPGLAAAVDDTASGDGDVLRSLGVYGRLAPFGVKPLEDCADDRVEVPAGVEDDDCVGGDVQVAVALEFYGACEPESGGDNQMTSAPALQGGESLAESLGAQAHSVSLGSEVGQADAVVGN